MPPQPQYTTHHRFPTNQRPEKRERAVPGWAIIGVFLILLFHFVTAASAFLMPVTLGILLFFVFVPFRRLMDRLGIGATVTAAIVTLGMVALVAVLGYFISGPLSDIVDDSDQIADRLELRLDSLRESFKPLEKAAAKIEEMTGGNDKPQPQPAATNSRL